MSKDCGNDLTYEQRLRRLNITLETRRLRGDLIMVDSSEF